MSSTTPTGKQLTIVGQYVKACDPEHARHLHAEGIRTVQQLGRYVYATDPEMFARILDNAQEQ